jgi:hypothetical protein
MRAVEREIPAAEPILLEDGCGTTKVVPFPIIVEENAPG